MAEFDFGTQGGGKRIFRSGPKLIEYLQAQEQEWTDTGMGEQVTALSRPWLRLRKQFSVELSNQPDNLDKLAHLLTQSPLLDKLVSVNSETGQLFVELYQEFGAQAVGGAIMYAQAAPNEPVLRDMSKGAIEGALAFRDRMSGISTAKSQAARNAIFRLKADLSNDVVEHRHELEGFEERHSETIEALEGHAHEQQEAWRVWVAEAKSGFAKNHQKWEADWLELYKDYTERLGFEAPVKLWGDRAEYHEGRAANLKWWVVGIGVLGTALAVLAASSAVNLGHWLFNGYGDAEGRRLTVEELIFAASATLLYLTLFFWMMRIVVRMYMTEHHLGIDARSRAAMVHTYLALTKEDAATDQDRAIVLGTIFRPVVDGIVKDDGLPAITPAALLSGLLGGKSAQ